MSKEEINLEEFISLLEVTGKKVGFEDGKKDAIKDKEFISYIENIFSQLTPNDIEQIINNPTIPSPNDCNVNSELLNQLKELDTPENCIPCKNKNKINLCYQNYALCTSAQCIKLPNNPELSICYCPVKKGCSLGTQSCPTLKPFKKGNLEFVYSTFSPLQITSNCVEQQSYPNKENNNTTFSNCLNQICIINPLDPSTAFCFCPLTQSNPYLTLGKTNNINNNPNIFLSGATNEGLQNSATFLQECKGISRPNE